MSEKKSRLKNPILKDWMCVPNCICRDTALDLKSRGLLITLLSLPDGWNFSIRGLAKIVDGTGYDGMQTGLKKLERLGYLKRERVHDEKGFFVGCDYTLIIPPEKPSESNDDLEF